MYICPSADGCVVCLQGGTSESTVSVTQSCLTLCDPTDCISPGSSVCGIFQARTLEWVATSFSGDLPIPGIELMSPVLQADSLSSEPQRKSY